MNITAISQIPKVNTQRFIQKQGFSPSDLAADRFEKPKQSTQVNFKAVIRYPAADLDKMRQILTHYHYGKDLKTILDGEKPFSIINNPGDLRLVNYDFPQVADPKNVKGICFELIEHAIGALNQEFEGKYKFAVGVGNTADGFYKKSRHYFIVGYPNGQGYKLIQAINRGKQCKPGNIPKDVLVIDPSFGVVSDKSNYLVGLIEDVGNSYGRDIETEVQMMGRKMQSGQTLPGRGLPIGYLHDLDPDFRNKPQYFNGYSDTLVQQAFFQDAGDYKARFCLYFEKKDVLGLDLVPDWTKWIEELPSDNLLKRYVQRVTSEIPVWQPKLK